MLKKSIKIIKKKTIKNSGFIFFAIFIFSIFTIYFLTSPGQTHHDYYYRLASSFLKGKLYLEENPSWLNELVNLKGKYYVVYPPMPAIMLVPFFGLLKQTSLSLLLGSANVLLCFLLLKKTFVNKNKALWLSLLFALGTNHWYLVSIGSAWYLAHIVAVFFILLALCEFHGKRRLFLVGLFVGAAYWSRLPTILSCAYFLGAIFLQKKAFLEKIPSFSKFTAGVAIFVFLNFTYNYLRFGTIFDIGYQLIPGVLDEAWYNKGIFSLSYVPRNLGFIIGKMPVFEKSFPFIFPSLEGMSLFLTTPAFLLLVRTNLKSKKQLLLLATILLLVLPSLMHGTVGFSQFGYRFSLDFVVFFLLLLNKTTGKKLKTKAKLLIIASIFINTWGVLMNNIFKLTRW